MNRKEAKRDFLEDLRSKVPNREVFAVATKSQLEVLAKQVISEVKQKVEDFLEEEDSYDFSMAEIPSDLWFEIVAFLVLTAKEKKIWLGSLIIGWADEQLLNLEDEAICEKIAEIRQILAIEESNCEQIASVTVDALMLYAKSNQPDF